MKTPIYGMTDDSNGTGYSSDPALGAEPGYRNRKARAGDFAYRPSFVGKAYAYGPGGSGSAGAGSSDASSQTRATETVLEVDHVSGNVTVYEVPVEPASSETVSLGVVVTP